MGSGARVLLAFLFASVAVMLTVGLIAAFGTPPWQDDGVPVSVADSAQIFPAIASDGSGGAIVTWGDLRDSGNTDRDVYAQRVDSGGNARWYNDGVSLCVASENQNIYRIVSDGSGGAIVTWNDRRSGSGNDDIYARRVYSDGTVAWAADGVSLCVAADDQWYAQIASDGSGGAIVTWEDKRDDGTTGEDIYAQRVDSGGNVLWQADGVSLSVASNRQYDPQIASDGSGGAFVTWTDGRNGSVLDIYARRVLSDGTAAWPPDGLGLCFADGDQMYPSDHLGW